MFITKTSMMHANACCTSNLLSTCDMLGYYNHRFFTRAHYSDDFTGLCSAFKMSAGSLLRPYASS